MTARILDVTRLASRAGRPPTGVDRVEAAYLRELISRDTPIFGLVRTAIGFVLLDRHGLSEMSARMADGAWAAPDAISRLNRRLSFAAKRGQSFSRRLAIAKSTRRGLRRMLRRHLPSGIEYLNVGHSNLTQNVLDAIKAHDGSRITILVHDTIPLDFPEYQRPGAAADFALKLRLASSYADRIICTCVACLRDVERHLTTMGRVPPLLPAQLGVPVPQPELSTTIEMQTAPYFVMVGTIEPRKNHAMILDLWERLGRDAPNLLICGTRGWNNAAVFDRLDAGIAGVTELSGLTDGQIATLLKGAQALLFPSFAEGYGLPPVEAAALGVPVLCADLPACREVLGNWPVYLSPVDGYQWENEIKRLTAETTAPTAATFTPPTWNGHFKLVFSEA